jgi:hypothetical protein
MGWTFLGLPRPILMIYRGHFSMGVMNHGRFSFRNGRDEPLFAICVVIGRFLSVPSSGLISRHDSECK